MSQCQTGGYVDFVKQYVLPFAGGSINYLLLDHIDKIPDIRERTDFEQLLRFMAKGDEYDPFQNIHDLGRTETINFGGLKNTLIMRCAEVPEFLQRYTYIIVDCRNYVQYVDEMLAAEKREDSQKQSTFAGRGSGKCGTVRLEDCIPPEGLKGLPGIGLPGPDLIDPEVGKKIAEAEGDQPLNKQTEIIKVKTFVIKSSVNPHQHERLDGAINKFLAENDIEVVDIKFSTAMAPNAQGGFFWEPSAC